MGLPHLTLSTVTDRFIQWMQLMGTYGLLTGTRIFLRMHSPVSGKMIRLPAGWVTTSAIELRKRDSDPEVFEQVFIDQQYHGVWRESDSPSWILDIGANIGLSALYFHNRFPEARILALEPSKANSKQLHRNTKDIPAITPVEAALWSRVEPVVIKNPTSVAWAFQVEQASAESTAVPGFTIRHLMDTYGIDRIDLLKIDIEGAERFVFEADTSWLSNVRVMAVELHDELTDGCSAALFHALQPYAYRLHTSGENLVIRFAHGDASAIRSETKLVA